MLRGLELSYIEMLSVLLAGLAFTLPPHATMTVAAPRAAAPRMIVDVPFHLPLNLIAEVIDSSGERGTHDTCLQRTATHATHATQSTHAHSATFCHTPPVYGAVDAPGWVMPVGGVLLIATALLPVLLAPGEEAFSQQRARRPTQKTFPNTHCFSCE